MAGRDEVLSSQSVHELVQVQDRRQAGAYSMSRMGEYYIKVLNEERDAQSQLERSSEAFPGDSHPGPVGRHRCKRVRRQVQPGRGKQRGGVGEMT